MSDSLLAMAKLSPMEREQVFLTMNVLREHELERHWYEYGAYGSREARVKIKAHIAALEAELATAHTALRAIERADDLDDAINIAHRALREAGEA